MGHLTTGERVRVWPVVAAVQLGVLLAALEATVVGTAMASLVAAVGGVRLYPWIFAAYMLSSTVVMPVFGALSDRVGRKRPYLVAVAVFAAGALLAGAAPGMKTIIAGRVLQGVGAGGLISLSLIIFADLFSGPRRGRMQGALTAVWGLASLVGPLLGGIIVDGWGWRWVFFVNLPLAGVVAVLITGFLSETAPSRQERTLDVAGLVTFAVGVTGLLFACLVPRGALAPRLVALGLAVTALVAMVRVERRAVDPVLAPALMRDRAFVTSGAAAFFSGAAMFGALIHVPLLMQWGRGTDATTAGLALMTMSGGWSAGGLVAGQAVHRLGFRPLTIGGMGLMSAGYVALALAPDASWRTLLMIGGAVGVGMGLSAVTLLLLVQTAVTAERRGVATAGLLFFRAVGGTLGVAVMGAVLTARLGTGLEPLHAGLQGVSPAMAASLTREIGQVFWLGVGATLLGLAATILTPPGTPAGFRAARPAVPDAPARRGAL